MLNNRQGEHILHTIGSPLAVITNSISFLMMVGFTTISFNCTNLFLVDEMSNAVVRLFIKNSLAFTGWSVSTSFSSSCHSGVIGITLSLWTFRISSPDLLIHRKQTMPFSSIASSTCVNVTAMRQLSSFASQKYSSYG